MISVFPKCKTETPSKYSVGKMAALQIEAWEPITHYFQLRTLSTELLAFS